MIDVILYLRKKLVFNFMEHSITSTEFKFIYSDMNFVNKLYMKHTYTYNESYSPFYNGFSGIMIIVEYIWNNIFMTNSIN